MDTFSQIGETQQAKRNQKIKRAFLKLDPDFGTDLVSSEDGEVKKEVVYEGIPGVRGHLATPRGGPISDQTYCHENDGSSRFSPNRSPSQEEEEPGKALLPGEPAIPVGHTTGAARLLLWPAVENFVGEKLRENKKNIKWYAE